jgi:hypothetical protein
MTLDEEIEQATSVVKEKQDILEKLEKEREDRKVKAVLEYMRKASGTGASEFSDEYLILMLAETYARGDFFASGYHISDGLLKIRGPINLVRSRLSEAYDKYEEYRREK